MQDPGDAVQPNLWSERWKTKHTDVVGKVEMLMPDADG